MYITLVHVLIFSVLLLIVVVYLTRNHIRVLLKTIMSSDRNKFIVSAVLLLLLILFVKANIRHFFYPPGTLILRGLPYDRVILLPLLAIFTTIVTIRVWHKTRNLSDVFLALTVTLWIFILFGFPEPKIYPN